MEREWAWDLMSAAAARTLLRRGSPAGWFGVEKGLSDTHDCCQEQGEASGTEPAAGLGSGMALQHQYGNSWEEKGKGAWVSSWNLGIWGEAGCCALVCVGREGSAGGLAEGGWGGSGCRGGSVSAERSGSDPLHRLVLMRWSWARAQEMEVSGGARGEQAWRVPEPCKLQESCGCHQAAPGDPQGLKSCTGRAGTTIAIISSPAPNAQPCPQRRHQPWLSPPSPGQAPRASAVTAQPTPGTAQTPPVTAQPTRVTARPTPRMAAALSHSFAAHPASAWWHPQVWGCERGLAPFLRLLPKPGQPQPVLGAAEQHRSLQDRTALQGRAVLRRVSAAALLLLALKSCSGAGAVVQQLWTESGVFRRGKATKACKGKPLSTLWGCLGSAETPTDAEM